MGDLSSLTSLRETKGDSNIHGDFSFETLIVNIKECLPNWLFHIIAGSTIEKLACFLWQFR